ncbi:MAG: lamin tail domain-containing protein, partial [Cyclobacteriaceae bacterium]
LTSVSVISTNQLVLTLNEKLENPISASVVFSISPNTEVVNYYFESLTLRSIILELAASIVSKQLYTVTIENLFDCSGNTISSDFNTATFALTEIPEAGDLLINEILFNPRPNGVDFVELYNASNKYINLKDLKIGNINEEIVENTKIISPSNYIMAPSDYLVLTTNPIVLKSDYPQGKEDKFLSTDLPSFPDDEGSVALVDNSDSPIDYLTYDKDFHAVFIKDEEGVSLERISFTANTNTKENWTSANSGAAFATPGYMNSNSRPEHIVDVGEIDVNPPILVPTSGSSEFSQINFQFDQPGFVANVKILDHQGRLIKTIANNEVLGHVGSFRWDGDTEDGSKARAGYYIVWFEVFNPLGNVHTYRKRVIVAFK